MPYNPDDLMVQCEGCSDWFHPACIEMTAEEAKRLDHFFCESCSSEGQKKLQNSHAASRDSDTKPCEFMMVELTITGLKTLRPVLYGLRVSRWKSTMYLVVGREESLLFHKLVNDGCHQSEQQRESRVSHIKQESVLIFDFVYPDRGLDLFYANLARYG
ncbi:hypothetical protein CRYUN_Cryun10bG0134000 [Craigia yunnanensis]